VFIDYIDLRIEEVGIFVIIFIVDRIFIIIY
jgi:hypothetical protein